MGRPKTKIDFWHISGVFLAVTCLVVVGLRAAPATDPEPVEIVVPALPSNPDAFLKLRGELPKTPEAGAALYIVAMLAYVNNEGTGLQLLTIALDRSQLSKAASGGYKGFRPQRALDYHLARLKTFAYLPYAYIVGSKQSEGYRRSPPFTLRFTRNRYSVQRNGDVKVFVETSGGVRARPVTLRKNNRGYWKVTEASSLFVGVPAPPQNKDDDL